MKEVDDLVKVFSKVVIDAMTTMLDKAPFDKTTIGVIKAIDGNNYTISAFGGNYTVRSSQTFAVNQRVAVTAPQGNFNNLIIRVI